MSEPIQQNHPSSPLEAWSLSMLTAALEENSSLASNVNGDSQPEIAGYVCPINLIEVS